jgi:hypothetical protein
MAGSGERDTMPTKQKVEKCVVFGNSIVCNVGADHADMEVECFPGIKTEHLIERMELVSAETLIIHVGTNDLRSMRNLDFIMGEVHGLVSTARRSYRTADFS